ncbi:M56 family metallopeptidase [Prosthecobacter sp.]|uniref:M56 family metallopeptidase n=1 Tax=Prosthecobacter sp. TaxID=1965333 RepID=UPI002ABBCDB3|nr:M56 family metallopeptidase [Prosthecobacter sp.]MDZ4401548.1 M56 family metallopeptidase [Prosthecobacter sp.]
MSTETITLLNFIVHSLVIGAAAWLLVRFVIRDALRRCILANLAILMCLYSPFDISMRDLFPPQQPVPVWTPLRETFEADWRVSVAPVTSPVVMTAAPAPTWDVNDVVKSLRWLAWLVTAALLLRLILQSVRVQCWAWRLKRLTQDQEAFIRDSVLECSSPLELSAGQKTLESAGGPAHSKTLSRLRVFNHQGTPCVAGWFFPVIAVPASAFEELTPRQWRWLLRHESEHLRCHDTVAVLLQNIVRAFLWWNPFIHALIEEYARAREEACDAAAVGEDRDHDDYADFLLAWAAKASPQTSCVMPIAHSRPARRLKARLVALMEARGVRKKLGALFVLGCAAFAVLTPFFAASFGIATANAQPAKSSDKDPTMFTRLYRVAPDFLADADNARSKLEKQGIIFPEGASALFQAATSKLIVRHHQAALDQIEAIIDRLHQRLPQVYFQCKFIQADDYFGTHEGILKPDEVKELLAKISQRKGIDLLSAPAVTTKMGQGATVEVVREILPEKPWDKNIAITVKFIGPSIKLVANPAPEGKATVEAKVDLGVDPDAEQPWLPKKVANAAWDRVQVHTTSAKAVLASGEALVMHLPTSKKPVTVIITTEALNPFGQKAISFESTATMQPSSTGINVPDKVASEWAVRVYKLPASFIEGKPPLEVLKAAGIAFPKGSDAILKDGKLTVRNTKTNLELIEAWFDALINIEVKKQARLTVQAVEMKGDFLKQLNDWLPPLPGTIENKGALAESNLPPPPEVLRQFSLGGVFTPAQFEIVAKHLADSGAKLETLKPNKKPQMYDLPAALGGSEIKAEPVIGPDGRTIDLIVHTPSHDASASKGLSTSVTIWEGQTIVLGAQPSEGVSRLLFITGIIKEEKDKK